METLTRGLKRRGRRFDARKLRRCLAAGLLCAALSASASEVINDVTQLNPIAVDRTLKPKSYEEVAEAVRTWTGPICMGGAKHSQGGQIAEVHALYLDMTSLDQVVALDAPRRRITVQAGITWRKIQEAIDPYDLSVAIMQTYDNFTVGGSLSVNCHGRYIGAGPIIRSVRAMKLLLADGSVHSVDPNNEPALFYGAIGGYGGLGVILEATLDLVPNTRVRREAQVVPVEEYRHYFDANVRHSPTAVFHNGDIYPPAFRTVRAVTWRSVGPDTKLTNQQRLISEGMTYQGRQLMMGFVSSSAFGKWAREYVFEPVMYLRHPVTWRNHEASYDVAELEPKSRSQTTYVLQEYFVPHDRFDEFVPKLRGIFQAHRVNVMNVSIRHSIADPGSMLAWANGEVFAFVVYYQQGTSAADRAAVGVWTREMIEAALDCGGSYYLPYQIWATPAQFKRAYPRSADFFAVKSRIDPHNRFTNQLWDAYYPVSAASRPTDH